MIGIEGRSSIYEFLRFGLFKAGEGFARCQSRRFEAQSAYGRVYYRVLLLAQADLLGRAERLAADAFGNLLNLAAGLEERCDLIVDRFAGFNGWSRLCFAGGCFYTHGGH